MSIWFGKKSSAAPSSTPPKPGRGKAPSISQLLSEETVLFAQPEQDKNSLLESMVNLLCDKKGLPDRQALLHKVMEREQGISTTLDTGLSLPHARVDGLKQIAAAIAISPRGIADPKQADLLIRVMFLFFSPNHQEAFPIHLQLLRGVSSLFQTAFIAELSRASSSSQVLELIRRQEG
ncbi:MAG: PTS sugar transporter subunit IIA [Elusimicrobia bacterium]|nr:PTS sugar transporter subunit IIA [Elusimicrobiota bacterium]